MEPLQRAKARAKERAKAKAKANVKVKTHPLTPVPLTPLELKVRAKIKVKAKAKQNNPQHSPPLPIPRSGPSFRAVRSANPCPFLALSSSLDGYPSPCFTQPSIPTPWHAPGRPFRAVRIGNIVTLPIPLQNFPPKPPQTFHRSRPPSNAVLRENNVPFTTPHISLSSNHHHWSSLWAVHLGPSGAAVLVPLLPLPLSPTFRDVLGRPFRAVRGTIDFLITLQTRTHLSQPRALANTVVCFFTTKKKKKYLSLFPPSLRPTRMEPPFVWQQGTWANAPAGDVPAP